MAETKTTTKVSDPWQEKLTIRVDRTMGKNVYVAVNGRAYLVPTGKPYDVPRPIYEKLMDMQLCVDTLNDVKDGIARDTEENMRGL